MQFIRRTAQFRYKVTIFFRKSYIINKAMNRKQKVCLLKIKS